MITDADTAQWCHLHPGETLDDDGTCEGCAVIAMCEEDPTDCEHPECGALVQPRGLNPPSGSATTIMASDELGNT